MNSAQEILDAAIAIYKLSVKNLSQKEDEFLQWKSCNPDYTMQEPKFIFLNDAVIGAEAKLNKAETKLNDAEAKLNDAKAELNKADLEFKFMQLKNGTNTDSKAALKAIIGETY